MRRQAKSALLDIAKWATGKPANRHKLQKNRTFVVQLCCPNSQTLHVPFKRRHVSKCLGCCEQQFYSWVLWEPGSGRINAIKPLCCTPWDLYSFVWHNLWASILHKQGGCRINKLGDRVEYQGQLYPAIKQHTQPLKHTFIMHTMLKISHKMLQINNLWYDIII